MKIIVSVAQNYYQQVIPTEALPANRESEAEESI